MAAAFGATRERLNEVLGASAPADHLKTVHLSMRCALRQQALARPVLSSSQALQDYLRIELAGEQVEQLRGLYLNCRNGLLGDVLLSRGTIGDVPLSPREIIRHALDLGATSLILFHNHPSGDPTPSKADIRASQELAEAAAMFDIHLHDHLIVGADSCVSLAALGLLQSRRDPA